MAAIETSFGTTHFGNADLGHKARNRCLVRVADLIHRHPGGTLPHKLSSPKDYKAMDRLMNRPETTHEAVLEAHRQRTLERMRQIDGPVLVLHDTTELDYSGLRSIADLGRIGNGLCRGLLCHNSLAYDPVRREVVGLANQVLHIRRDVGRKEKVADKRARVDRETRLWVRGAEAVGAAPPERLWVNVSDRGSDTFENLAWHMDKKASFVIRSPGKRIVRLADVPDAPVTTLKKWAASLPAACVKSVEVGARGAEAERTAKVEIAHARIVVHPPHVKRGVYVKRKLEMWMVVVREADPPEGREPLDWILLTNVPVNNAADALERAEWYERRWVAEEFHKGMKTGCGIEDLQFASLQALKPMVALLSVVAVTLLGLRDASRDAAKAKEPATRHVDAKYVEVLSAWRHKGERRDLTTGEFFLALARLGGHMNRKRDKPPGWIVLWRGWMALQHMLDGAEAMGRFKNRGVT